MDVQREAIERFPDYSGYRQPRLAPVSAAGSQATAERTSSRCHEDQKA
jgi:hypothetical protein